MMKEGLRRRPLSVALFLAFLALPQGFALARQFQLGFRPLGNAPKRVPLSWDMFATSIERCRMNWQPPISVAGRRVESLGDLMPLWEWDVIRDDAGSYGVVGHWGCRFARVPTRVRMRCFGVDGQERDYGFDCP